MEKTIKGLKVDFLGKDQFNVEVFDSLNSPEMAVVIESVAGKMAIDNNINLRTVFDRVLEFRTVDISELDIDADEIQSEKEIIVSFEKEGTLSTYFSETIKNVDLCFAINGMSTYFAEAVELSVEEVFDKISENPFLTRK